MNKLDLTLLGGLPFRQNTLEFQFLAYNRAFSDLLTVYGGAYILHGCAITQTASNVYTVGPGAVAINGEAYVWQGALAVSIPDLNEAWFTIAASLDPSGEEPFEDLVERNPFQIRVAAITQNSVQPANSVGILGPRIEDRIYALINNSTIPWVEHPLLNGWLVNESLFLAFIYFRRELGKVVRMRGQLIGGSATNALAFTLPVGYRPAFGFKTVLHSTTDPTITAIATIATNGNVSVSTFGGADQVFSLADIPAFEAQ